MGKPKPPQPPDPGKTASAQTATNIGTSIANTAAGQVDQYTPEGSLTYEQIGTYDYKDPISGKIHKIPKYKATTALSESAQNIFNQAQGAQLGLASTANQQASFLKQYLGKPAAFDTAEIEGRLMDLGRQRLDPMFSEQEDALRQRLAGQGLSAGSEAWDTEMRRFQEGRNDAYNNLMLQGRGQAFSELGAIRNQPINEITALLSGSQVSQPNVHLATPSKAATTDYAGIVNQNYNQKFQNYQSKLNQQNSLMGGLFGLGSSVITGGFF